MPKFVYQALALLLCTALLIGPGGGQQPSPPGKQEPAKLRVTTRLVQINVIVHDKQGHPVSDLTRDDFVIKEEGVEQPIQLFSMETNQALKSKQPPLAANTYSNRHERRGETPTSVSAVLLDTLNTRFEDQVYAKDQIVKFLKQLQPQDRVALYALGGKLRVLHDFTRDASSVLRTLEKYRGAVNTAVDTSEPADSDTGNDQLDAWLNDSNQRIANFYITDRVLRTCDAMEAIAHHLTNLPGRKNLIWVSGSFPISFGYELDRPTSNNLSADQRMFTPEIEKATRALNDANLAVYPVDARGLIGAFGTNPNFSRGGTFRPGRPGSSPLGSVSRTISTTHDTMRMLAERTGGQAFYNTNDISGAIRRAIEDSRVTYVLGYHPTHGKWDGKFHEVKVQVKRPGTQVRHRRGYFAWPDLPLDDKSRNAALSDASRSPLEATGIGVLVQVKPPSSEGDMMYVVVKLDPREINFNEDGGRQNAELDILFHELSPEGALVKSWDQTLHMHLFPDTYQGLFTTGLLLQRYLEKAKGATQLRIVVRDARSGSVGSVNFTLPTPAS